MRAFIAVFEVGTKSETSLLVPIILGIAVLAAITLMRGLQNAAFIDPAGLDTRTTGQSRTRVILGVHREPLSASDRGDGAPEAGFSLVEIPEDGRDVAATLDGAPEGRCALPAGCGRARRCSYPSLIVPGATIFDGDRVAVVVDGRDLSDQAVRDALGVGSERTFDQDARSDGWIISIG